MIIKTFAVVLLSLTLSIVASAQMTVNGTAIDVVDGKTVLIELPNGKVRAEMQFIEVPENGQQLHEVVVQHLRGLVVGRPVSFRAQQIMKDRTVGLLMVGEVDIAQQMLRDGAAWHIRYRPTGQNGPEAKNYESNEADARSEKRGVWSIEGMKTAWQYRADRDSATSATVPVLTKEFPVERTQIKKPTGYWGDVNPRMQNIGALANGYNAATRTGYLSTALLGVDPIDAADAALGRVAIEITYVYKEYEVTGRRGDFIVTVMSISGERWRFLEKNELVVLADDKKMVVGKPKRTSEIRDGKHLEKLTYTVDRTTLDRAVNGSDVKIRVGTYNIVPYGGFHMMVNNMLQLTK